MKTTVLTIAALCLATLALAHSGVKNPAVMARMDAMSGIGASMKVLGDMAKGTRPFDAAAAQAAAARISALAAETPALFEAPEQDPKSEALPAIWSDFDSFAAIARDLAQVSGGLTLAAPADLAPALRSLGQTCQACHQDYRLDR